jgi:Spy/CpxP family protein refolding chaperone
MKKTLFTLIAVTIASVSIMAQDSATTIKKGPEKRVARITDSLAQQLGLSAEQKTKVAALFLQREQENIARAKEEQARRLKMDADMKAILTPEQYQKMLDIKQNMKAQRKANKLQPAGNK